MAKPNDKLMDLFTQVANKHLGVETLEVRNRDCLDFHDVSVGSIVTAFAAVYEAGLVAGQHTLTKQK